MPWIRILRADQWTKNLILLAGLIFSQRFFELSYYWNVVCAFFSFSLLSSTIYVINDIVDCDLDRQNPEKCKRPLPSGDLSMKQAVLLSLCICGGSFLLAYSLHSSVFLKIWLAYLIMMILYSFVLKHIPIMDVGILGFGFVLRAQAGVTVIQEPLSHLFLSCAFFLALFLGFCKRRHECLHIDMKRQRKVLKYYTRKSLSSLILAFAVVTVGTYLLYALSPDTLERFDGRSFLWSFPFVLLGVGRYLQLVFIYRLGGHPERILLTDLVIIASVVCWVLSIFCVIYGGAFGL
jgi:4-hydroxybenzoate polyprenyltransferase